MALLLKNAHVVDPSVELDGVVDVLIDGDKIAEVGENLAVEGAEVRDLSGKYLVPGLVDMHVHLREPGYEVKEDIEKLQKVKDGVRASVLSIQEEVKAKKLKNAT